MFVHWRLFDLKNNEINKLAEMSIIKTNTQYSGYELTLSQKDLKTLAFALTRFLSLSKPH